MNCIESRTTPQQLEAVLSAITHSRHCLVLVVTCLLADLRTPPHTPVAPSPPAKTLVELTRVEGRKRKRSITHFEGIPMSIIRASEPKAPENRQVSTSRRMKELEKIMGRMEFWDKPDQEVSVSSLK
jgi:hypothetical protein